MPDSAAIRRFQTRSAPTPRGVTSPRPVTTTRLMRRQNSSWMRFDELNSVFDGHDLFGGIVGNLATEFLFERHHELDRVETIGAQIVDETGVLRDLGLVDAQVLDHDFLYPLGDIAHQTFLDKIDAQIRLSINGSHPGRPKEPVGKRRLLT